jgi:hypothetical protein
MKFNILLDFGFQTVNYCSNAQNVELAFYDEVKKISLEENPKVLMVDVRLESRGQIQLSKFNFNLFLENHTNLKKHLK